LYVCYLLFEKVIWADLLQPGDVMVMYKQITEIYLKCVFDNYHYHRPAFIEIATLYSDVIKKTIFNSRIVQYIAIRHI